MKRNINVMSFARYFRYSALSFSISMGLFALVALWSNFRHYDRALLLLAFEVLILGSGCAGLLFALFGYGKTPNRPEWRVGVFLFAGATLAGIAAITAIKAFFPELPE